MKGTSKVIMGATLVMVVSLAVVLGLILVLLAELYCSLLLRRRRQLRNTNSNSNTIPIQTPTTTVASGPSPQASFPQEQSPPSLFSSIYAQGVLQAPRSFLFPEAATKEDMAEPKKQLSELHQVIQTPTQESNSNVSPRQIGLLSASSPPPSLSSFISKTLSKPIEQDPLQDIASAATICPDKSSRAGEHLVYISNPIYENGESNPNTPFETPDTSPSRLERSCSSGDDDAAAQGSPSSSSPQSPPYTPPLTPMKKLPAEACSVSLRDARSLGTSGSDSNGLSSSSSASPCTSPSW
ncbi:hypothetical protein L6164_007976 [Bauhinia variegata]|uniref:Uncharacterized protein n=1 Tax=Bauhinia variegata TaxID=167791 RepID=A0ACB9PF91_BAUVA|nr:hypothetical protein L6164_007976 [Bauhinia variegata]